MYHAKDLDKLAFGAVLWEKLESSDVKLIKEQMFEDGVSYFNKHVKAETFNEDMFKDI